MSERNIPQTAEEELIELDIAKEDKESLNII